MHDQVCEQCGNRATVTIASVGPTRDGERPPPHPQHRYCVDCARLAGVPIRRGTRDFSDLPEPQQMTWPEIEQHLAQYEQILGEEPQLRERILTFVGYLRRYSAKTPGEMPQAIAERFRRLSA